MFTFSSPTAKPDDGDGREVGERVAGGEAGGDKEGDETLHGTQPPAPRDGLRLPGRHQGQEQVWVELRVRSFLLLHKERSVGHVS